MKTTLAICLMLLCAEFTAAQSIVVTVRRDYSPRPKDTEAVTIALAWSELAKRLPDLKKKSARITDNNFGDNVVSKLVDTNGDKKADYLVFDHVFKSNEPVFAFQVEVGKENVAAVSAGQVIPDKRLVVDYLKHFFVPDLKTEANSIARRIVQTTLNKYPDTRTFPIYAPDRWNYEYSFFLFGSYQLGKKLNIPEFVEYPQRWIDRFIADEGGFKNGIYAPQEYKLDDIIPARLAILFHQQTGQAKYKTIVDTMIVQLEHQPKTKDGGYWHKQVYEHQMWLDGIFMADVFSMQYAKAYNKPEWFDEATHQVKLMYKHAADPKTGLLYHGWDEAKNPVWAHPEKGTSPEFWARGIGWYAMALAECLDYLPADHKDRNELIRIFKDVCASVKKYQHADNHLWYQVIDKSSQPGNWPETSASAMFAFAFARGYHQKHLDESFLKSSEQAFDSLLKNFVYADDKGDLHLDQTVKVGTLSTKTSKGDYQYYTTTERRINDYKGLAALLYTAIELER